jgi:transcriptional regulator with XRE-family HTH domain
MPNARLQSTPDFAIALRRYRQSAGISQRELARRAGYSADYVSMLERGVRLPGPGTLAPLLEALELSEPERLDLQRATWSARPSSPTFDPPPLGSRLELVERDAEQSLLGGFVNSDEPALFLVGEAGIGKTRLLEEARRLAVARGITTLAAGANGCPSGAPYPYAPILDALSAFVHAQSPRRLRGLLHGCEWLARLLPELLDMDIAPPDVHLPPDQERRQVFRAVARFLTQSAGPAGTLLVLDDLQSAGPEVFELLGYLLTRPIRVRLLGAYRPGDLPPIHPLASLVSQLLHRDDLGLIHLQPLSPDGARRLMTNMLPTLPPNDRRLEDAVCLSDGIPLYLVCFARGLRPQLYASTPAHTTASNGVQSHLPTGLVEIVRSQLARVSAPCRELLRAIARGATPSLSRETLVGSVQQPEPTVQNALDELVRLEMLREVEPDKFAFTHQVVRMVAATTSLA